VAVVVVVAGLQIYLYVNASTMNKAQNVFGKAMILYQENQPDKALEAFKEVCADYGKTPLGYYSAYMLGEEYLKKGNYNEALVWLEKVASGGANIGFVRGESLEAIGTCYDAMNEREKALEYFSRALKDNSVTYRHPAICWKMALIYQLAGNKDKVNFYCNELISDTLAADYRKKAENMLAIMQTL
jgi:tetratricopeptide (TPR) repeat protein